jgi:AAA family ATP:ADP antiporter
MLRGGLPVATQVVMSNVLSALRSLTREQRQKAALLSGWFFITITTLWLLKPIRQASLLAHLGAAELPYVRFGSVIAVALVVLVYSRVVDRLTRLQVARGASLVFAAVLLAIWIALRLGGEALGGQRWFVWLVFILVDIYSTVMVGIFWTYTNDVCSREEGDKLYGPIGIGGIVGGIAGGALVDALVRWIGQVDLLLVCVALRLASAAIVAASESLLHPRPRPIDAKHHAKAGAAFEGARLVGRSPYLLLIVGVVVGYEFAAAVTDFVVSVVFERAYPDQAVLAQMFGRLGWIVSAVALLSQLVVVPLLLPRKRVALLVPPLAMGLATLGLAIVPIVAMAFVLSASDRGLNYSLQQVTKETLYIPLTDVERYKAKAFIDMFVDRAGKAVSSLALVIVIAASGVSIEISLGVALGALLVWLACAALLGPSYARKAAASRVELARPPESAAARA